MKIKSIQLVKVQSTEAVIFESAIEKERFLSNHQPFEYNLDKSGNSAQLKQFICIDTAGNGFILNTSPLNYNRCLSLIEMYY